MERFSLAPGYEISRLIKGGWHLAGGHGAIATEQAIDDMAAFVEAGIDTFDCADIYTGVESLIGDFRRRHPTLAARLHVHTKYVPDLGLLPSLTGADVSATIERSLTRLGVEQLDLVQFHWWDFAVPGYVEAAMQLERLRQDGKIARIGVTNFDVMRLRELLDAGVPVRAHQLQYSVLDERPEYGMVDLCLEKGITLLAYGTVAGGFLSERWLGQAEPAEPLANRSLVKYRLIIEEFGDWAQFQGLLQCLQRIAQRHGVDIATVATRFVLQKPSVGAAIVGATNRSHLDAHQKVSGFKLTSADLAELIAVTEHRRGPHGDVYALERDRSGRHGKIMKYNLGTSATPQGH